MQKLHDVEGNVAKVEEMTMCWMSVCVKGRVLRKYTLGSWLATTLDALEI